jgi:hypothetical protein
MVIRPTLDITGPIRGRLFGEAKCSLGQVARRLDYRTRSLSGNVSYVANTVLHFSLKRTQVRSQGTQSCNDSLFSGVYIFL